MNVKPLIVVISGSASDSTLIQPVLEEFREEPVRLEYYIASAHRSVDKLRDLVKRLEGEGARVFIGVAGFAAHLPGVIAAMTQVPVYGVPVGNSDLKGVDALYSMVMMPGGVPVACFGLGQSGLKNAVLMALSHLAHEVPALRDRMMSRRKQQTDSINVAQPQWRN
jgi:phosphoribosylaminoimidazole carboxylase PurE protein